MASVFGDLGPDDPSFDLLVQLLANVSRFSAFKAQQALDELLDIPDGKDPALHISDIINKFNRYQAAEYNTATARSADQGLDSNPASSGKIFTDKASYFHNATKTLYKAAESFFNPIAEHHNQYVSLIKDQDYSDQLFNWDNGGLKAIHKDHNFDMVGDEYELHVVEAGFSSGVAVILGKEVGPTLNFRFVEGTWNGASFEVAGREAATANNVLWGLKHCAAKRTTKIAVLDYPNGGFDETILLRAIDRYKGLKKLNDGQYVPFEKIICVQDQ